MILVPGLVWLLRATHSHYVFVDAALAIDDERVELAPRPADLSNQPVVVPVRELNLVTLQAVEYARGISRNVVAAHVDRGDPAGYQAMAERWQRLVPDVPLITIDSPYRTFMGPFLAYADRVAQSSGGKVMVVVPEFRPAHWWESLLHNRTGRLIEDAADDHPQLAVTVFSVPLPRGPRGG